MHEHVGKCVVNTVFCPPLICVSNPEKPKNIMRKCQGKASINKEAWWYPSSQKTFSDKTGLGYTWESSSAMNITKEVKFVKAKEPVVVALIMEKTKGEKKKNVANQQVLNKPSNQLLVRSAARAKSLPRSQRGPRMNHLCHHCGL